MFNAFYYPSISALAAVALGQMKCPAPHDIGFNLRLSCNFEVTYVQRVFEKREILTAKKSRIFQNMEKGVGVGRGIHDMKHDFTLLGPKAEMDIRTRLKTSLATSS